jgi:hypothetical protein
MALEAREGLMQTILFWAATTGYALATCLHFVGAVFRRPWGTRLGYALAALDSRRRRTPVQRSRFASLQHRGKLRIAMDYRPTTADYRPDAAPQPSAA